MRLLTMWHKLALSVIPPVRTQHAIVRRLKYVLGNFIFALLTPEVKLNTIF